MTVITVVAIAAIAALFVAFVLPKLKNGLGRTVDEQTTSGMTSQGCVNAGGTWNNGTCTGIK